MRVGVAILVLVAAFALTTGSFAQTSVRWDAYGTSSLTADGWSSAGDTDFSVGQADSGTNGVWRITDSNDSSMKMYKNPGVSATQGLVMARIKYISSSATPQGNFGYTSALGNHSVVVSIRNGQVNIKSCRGDATTYNGGNSVNVPGGTAIYRVYALRYSSGGTYDLWVSNSSDWSNVSTGWTQLVNSGGWAGQGALNDGTTRTGLVLGNFGGSGNTWDGCVDYISWIDSSANPWEFNPVVTLPEDSAYVSDTIPSFMVQGQTYNVSVTFKNIGSNNWSRNLGVKLGAVGDSDPFCTFNRVDMGLVEVVSPNNNKTFTFNMTAPSTLGTYITDWQMIKNTTWFGAVLTKQVEVTGPDSAEYVSDTIPTTMSAGQTYNVSVTMRNIGTSTWTIAEGYKLGAVDDSDPFANGRVDLGPSDSIAPGSTKTFDFVMTAPSLGGTYTTDWRMVHEHVNWFGQTLTKEVVVQGSDEWELVLNDPLQGSSSGTINGGQFVTGGWQTLGNSDSIRWSINPTVARGKFEFDVTNLSPQDTNPSDGKGELAHMYDNQPSNADINKMPGYDDNLYGVWIRKLGVAYADANHDDAVKVLANAGVPGQEDYCAQLSWDPNTTYHFVTTWEPGSQSGTTTFKFWRDSTLLKTLTVDGDSYNPQEHRVRIGASPRNNTIPNAIFSNVRVWKYADSGLVLDDPLLEENPNPSPRFSRSGGSFQDGGWKVTGRNDYLVWHLPNPIQKGKVAFDIKGINPNECRAYMDDKTDIFHMYDWTYGNADTDYNGYRNNPYKHFIRKIGCHGGATNALELVWVINPNYEEPDTSTLDWNSGTTYHFEETWETDTSGNCSLKTYRDGALLRTITIPGVWNPTGHSVRIGIAHPDYSAPLDAVFSNMKVWDLSEGGEPQPDGPFTDLTNYSGTAGPSYYGGHGAMWADATGDGKPDCYVTMNFQPTNMGELFYRNIDGSTFAEEAASRGIDDFDTGSHGGVWADFDNDGDYDLINGGFDRNRIWQNNGSGQFTEKTATSGFLNVNYGTRGAVAFDANNDGHLDLLCNNWWITGDITEPNEFYINNGDFTFTSANNGLANLPSVQGVTAGDYDNDGDLDIILCRWDGPITLMRNTGGQFAQVARPEFDVTGPRQEGATFVDVDNDGWLDLHVQTGDYVGRLFINNKNGTFTAKAVPQGPGFMAGFADLNNDGKWDMVYAGDTKVYHNDGAGNFTASTSFNPGGIDDPRAVAFADIDADGDMDFFYAQKRTYNRLIRNNLSPTNANWLKIKLVGPNGQAGAFGAKVKTFEAGQAGNPASMISFCQASSQEGYLGQNEPILHFGLGSRARIDVQVTFLNGTVVTRSHVAAGQVLTVDARQAGMTRSAQQYLPTEFEVNNPTYSGNPFDLIATATFVHPSSGETRTTGMFYAGGNTWKFRFTGTRPGTWNFTTSSSDSDLNGLSGTVNVQAATNDQRGFVSHVGNRWIRPRGPQGISEAFVPQFIMYAHMAAIYNNPAEIDADIQTFFVEHGFNGFHVGLSCRWFDINQDSYDGIPSMDPNPDIRSFEALELLINKTHEAGGVVHIWAWGDESRHATPYKWGVNGTVDRRLQRYIAARLGPLPNWSMGYGFDLWEWTTEPQLASWHDYMQQHFGWKHYLGARNFQQDIWTQLSESLDYSSYEHWRPDYNMYVMTMDDRPTKPSFSEDRFRIRDPSPYPEKDYDEPMTRRGLWHSTMAGGVANIWGNLVNAPDDWSSAPYPHPEWSRTNKTFFEYRFLLEMVRDNALTNGVCLRTPDSSKFVFYREDASSISMNLSAMSSQQPAVAVDTKLPYQEINIGPRQPGQHTWTAPYASDWAIAVGDFPTAPPQGDPPGPVTGFSGTAGDMRVDLSWTNPTDANFTGTKILYKTSGYPTNGNDGTVVYDGAGTTCTHTGITTGVTYYYGAFAHDATMAFATAATCSVVSTTDYCYADDFSYANGSLSGVNGWSGTGGSNIGIENQSVKITSGATNLQTIKSVSCSGVAGIIWVRARIQAGYGIDTLWSLRVDDPSGINLARWYGSGTTARGRIADSSTVTGVQNLSGVGVWDSIVIKINTTTNQSEFFLNGLSMGSLDHTTAPGNTVGSVWFERVYNTSNPTNEYVYLDELTVGGPETTTDTDPPGPVAGFSAAGGPGQVSLAWTSPADSDFAGTLIRFKTNGYPANAADGSLAVNKGNTPGSSDNYTHTGLTGGITYYYSAFAYDASLNYSTKVDASAVPSAPPCFSDAFPYPNGNLNGNNGWSGAAGAEISVTDQAVKITGGSTTTEVGRTISPCTGSGGIISARFQIKAGVGTTTLWGLYIDDPAGLNLAKWYGTGSGARGRIGNTNDVTPMQTLTGTTTWDTCEVRINTATNNSEFFFNGTSIGVWSHASQGSGDSVGRLRFERIYNSLSVQNVYIDNLIVGTADTTPPSAPANLMAAGSSGQVALTWANPTSDFAETRILFKTTGYPTSQTDGTVIYTGTGTSHAHTGLTNGTRYYYAAYARDEALNYSSASTALGVAALDATITGAKALDNNQVRYLRNKTVTAAFTGYFYVQEPVVPGLTDLHAGIKVQSSTSVAPGNSVTVSGPMAGKNAERYLNATGYTINVTTPGPGAPAPVSLSNAAVGGALLNSFTPGVMDGIGPNNIGSYVRVWGKVTQTQTSPIAYFYISDGSTGSDGLPLTDGTQTSGANNIGIRVEMNPGSYQTDDYVVVTGVVSLFDDGQGHLCRKIIPVSAQKLAP